jgi:hypothetical protein
MVCNLFVDIPLQYNPQLNQLVPVSLSPAD